MSLRTTETETEALDPDKVSFLELIAQSSFAAEHVEHVCRSAVAFLTEDDEDDLSLLALPPSGRTLWEPSLAEAALPAARQAERMDLQDEARLWYYHAAVAGHRSAYRPLAEMLECVGQFEAARQWYHAGAEAGDVASALRLAVDYQLCGFRQLGAAMLQLASSGLSEVTSKILAEANDSLGTAVSNALQGPKRSVIEGFEGFELGSVLFLIGRTEDAVKVYQLAARSGYTLAEICLERLAARHPEQFLTAVSTDQSGTHVPTIRGGRHPAYHPQTPLPPNVVRIATHRPSMVSSGDNTSREQANMAEVVVTDPSKIYELIGSSLGAAGAHSLGQRTPPAVAQKILDHAAEQDHATDRSPVLNGLEPLLRETDFAWSLVLIGEDPAGKLATLTGDLRRGVSTTGDGKRITSGFSYLGTEPAIAWANACRDPLCPVMKQSIGSFDLRWRSIRESLGGKPYHYVSLGPGDGQKDVVILQDLMRNNTQLCYVAVDMSTEMLRLGVPALIRELKLSRSRVLPVQLDFSSWDNVAELCRVLDVLFGEEAVLFSLLGNTMTNFENDTELLRMLAEQLLRPQDRFVLEVATTPQLDDTRAQEAAEEYRRSRTFREFITSALTHYTDLHIDMGSVMFQGSVEGERALLVKAIYQNGTGRDVRITLPGRTDVPFPRRDTIRLGVSRKYMRDHLKSLLVDSGVHELASSHFDFGDGAHNDLGFGMDLLVLTADSKTTRPKPNMAEYLWR